MKRTLLGALFAISALFVSGCTTVLALNPPDAKTAVPQATTPAVALSLVEEQAIVRSVMIEVIVCGSIYPPQDSASQCFDKMRDAMEKEFPDAVKRPDDPALTAVFAGGAVQDKMLRRIVVEASQEPEYPALMKLNQRIFVSCRSEPDFARCMDKAYHTLAGAFDPHSGYFSQTEMDAMQSRGADSFVGVGMELAGGRKAGEPLIVVNPMEGSPALKAGILPGDEIVGISADGSPAGMRPFSSYSNSDAAVKDIRGKKGTPVLLEIKRPSESKTLLFTIVRDTISTPMVKTSVIQDGGKTYGVLTIRAFDFGVCKKVELGFKQVLKDAGGKLDGLIVSVENNPGGLLHETHCILDRFSDAPSFILMRDRSGIEAYDPCRANMFGFMTCQGGYSPLPGDMTGGLPILVMINGGSASASEIFSASMKHTGRGVIAGTPSFRKGTAQSVMPLPGGGELHVTGHEFLIGTEKDWIPVQCLGVTPDLVFDRGRDPKNEKGEPFTDCALDGSLRSLGGMENPPTHPLIKDADPAKYKAGEEMLTAYKNYVTPLDQAQNKRNEILKKRMEELEKKQSK